MSPSTKVAAKTDEALMVRVQSDDTGAFAELYDRHAARAFLVARAVCRDPGRAEDAVQEGFLAIWKGRDNYRPEVGTFRAWSMTIVQNRAIDSLRRTAARPAEQARALDEDFSQPDLGTPSPSEEAIARSAGEEMIASLGRLPEAQAKVIVLAFYGQLSQSEIAAQLALPMGTVKGRMRLGLEKLRYEMDASKAVT